MQDGDVNYLLWRLRSTLATDRVPVFVMCNNSVEQLTADRLRRDVCGKQGALRVFRKPLDIDELLVAIKKHCALEYKRV